MLLRTQHDPEVEGVLKLARATGFRAPEGSNTRQQLLRCLQGSRGQQGRTGCAQLVEDFRSAESVQAARQHAEQARAAGAQDRRGLRFYKLRKLVVAGDKEVTTCLEEEQQALHQLRANITIMQTTLLEERGKLCRLSREQQELAERACSLGRLRRNSRKRQPLLEAINARQQEYLRAVRGRLASERDLPASDACQQRVAQLCQALQQELWQQLNTASINLAEAASSLVPSRLLLADNAMTADLDASLALVTGGPGARPLLERLEEYMHPLRTSTLHLEVLKLLAMAPKLVVRAVGELCRSSQGSMDVRLGVEELLDDVKRRWRQQQQQMAQAAGVPGGVSGAASPGSRLLSVVDPLHEMRQRQQALVDDFLSVKQLRLRVQRAKLRLLELAQSPHVWPLLEKNPEFKLKLQLACRRSVVRATEACRQQLRSEVENGPGMGRQGPGVGAAPAWGQAGPSGVQGATYGSGLGATGSLLDEEVTRLTNNVMEAEREHERMERLVEALCEVHVRTMQAWQQGYAANSEFVQHLLPAMYGQLAEGAAQRTNMVSGSMAALLGVPQELLPLLAEQRLAGRAAAGADAGQQAAAGNTLAGGAGLPVPTLVQRMELCAPLLSSQRMMAALRAATSAGTAAAPSALAHHSSSWHPGSSGGAAGGGGGGFGAGHVQSAGSVFGGLANSAGSGGNGGSSADGAGSIFGSSGFGAGSLGGAPGGRGLQPAVPALPGPAGVLAPQGAPAAQVVQWQPGQAQLGLPTVCYWVAVAAGVERMAAVRCPAELLRRMNERFMWQWEQARWMSRGDAYLQARQRELSALGPQAAALQQRLAVRQQEVAASWVSRLARSRGDLVARCADLEPRVKRVLHELQEQGAVKLVPWRKVDGRTAEEFVEEIRSLFSKLRQVQGGTSGGLALQAAAAAGGFGRQEHVGFGAAPASHAANQGGFTMGF